MSTEYVCEWRYAVEVNKARGARDRLGAWLRTLAGAIDGRTTLAVRIDTTPALTRAEQVACIEAGIGHMTWAVRDTVQAAACEAVLDRILANGQRLGHEKH